MFEFIQGEGGVNVLEQAFVDEIFAIAQKHDLATISDEVQTGMGRTAKLLGGKQFGGASHTGLHRQTACRRAFRG